MSNLKTLIIGWDGATFDMIKPLVKQGRLPNIAYLMNNGVWGELESTIPPLTPVAWTSMSTGVNPGKHGIFDAIVYTPEGHKLGFANAAMCKVKPLWSILSERGRKAGVMNVPLTYPTDKINGFVIPGMFTPNEVKDFIYPSDLQAEIENKFGKYVIECRQDDDPETYLKLILDVEVNLKEEVALYLMERYPLDFFFVTFMASDRVQHFFWKYLDPSHPEHNKYGEYIALVYERLDQALGHFMERVGPDTCIIMVSDHGSGTLTSTFFLNNWLMKNGYLCFKEDPYTALKRKKSLRVKSELIKSFKKVIPSIVLNKIKPRGSNVLQEKLNLLPSLIDWEKTVAFSEGVAGGIYINPQTVKPGQYKDLLFQLSNDLYKVTDPSGKRVIKTIYRRDELYDGEYVDKAPDLTVICSEGYQVITPNEFLFFNKEYEDALFLPHRWSGRHEQYGIFLLKGPGVKKNTEINNARIIDIAPMVLFLMNEAIPECMDGKVLDGAVEKEYLLRNPIRYTSNAAQHKMGEMNLSAEEEKEIKERLRGLGYME